jgi:hypothetical protein
MHSYLRMALAMPVVAALADAGIDVIDISLVGADVEVLVYCGGTAAVWGRAIRAARLGDLSLEVGSDDRANAVGYTASGVKVRGYFDVAPVGQREAA